VTDDPKPDPPKPDELGDGGKRALEAERTARRDAERRASEAEDRIRKMELEQLRSSVASSKGLTAAQAKRLAGSTKEELEADADDLLTAFKPAPSGGPPSRKPTADLKGGNDPTEDVALDPKAIADKVFSRGL
jgi:hypothetical protein